MNYAANNPFQLDPQSRFPALEPSPGQDPTGQFTQWLQPGMQSPGGNMGPQYSQQQFTAQQPQQPQFHQQFQPQAQQFSPGYAPQQQWQGMQSPIPFQPTSSYGQQLPGQPHISGSSYGYLQQQNTSAGTAYTPAQAQLQSPGYAAQFDPYSALGQGWDGVAGQSQQQPAQLQTQAGTPGSLMSPGGAQSPTTTSTSPTGQLHPRDFVRVNKARIEIWDPAAWRDLFAVFDGLKDAWGERKTEILDHVGTLQGQAQAQMQWSPPLANQYQSEAVRLQAMAKEAESNADSISASSFQMHEVFANYRKSGDLSSKSRVREASNAALTSLPDWPPVAY
ncbi:unnamed protein product [Mycena citricolor]|uniref:Uncharacterized protein n=1 Tax=Mycena citricolor TaxID=2018698 RepID=A0AAD2H5H9_9AGAR|nr:unnamed protein product [Mycena citricolor]